MKLQYLFEIIQARQEIKRTENIFDKEKARIQRDERESRGHNTNGAYARVYNAGNPHMVIKTNHVPIKPTDDAYLNYIRYIVDNNLASRNPFFPRIYKIKYFEDKHENVKYKIEMETLHELGATDSSVLISFVESLFSSKYYDETDIKRDTQFILAGLVESVITNHITSKNKLLNEAAAVIRKIKNETDSKYDIFPFNLMVRLSPIPQLVIIDPLSNN